MTRSEILQTAKPILFNTDMVRAILDGRKTVTRRGIKFPVNKYTGKVPGADNVSVYSNTMRSENVSFHEEPFYCLDVKPPYNPRDFLYVRETWCALPINEAGHMRGHDIYYYRADGDLRPIGWKGRWRPSIHMPKEAARIFLRVTDVRVKRLQDITEEQAIKEGQVGFMDAWNSTIQKKDLDKYGWDANPWVWVIEFERVEVEA